MRYGYGTCFVSGCDFSANHISLHLREVFADTALFAMTLLRNLLKHLLCHARLNSLGLHGALAYLVACTRLPEQQQQLCAGRPPLKSAVHVITSQHLGELGVLL